MSRDERSKTQRKRDAERAQQIGEKLIALTPEKLAGIDLPESLRSAIETARGMHQHGALRRQKQLVGKLMRQVDTQPIEIALAKLSEPRRRETGQLHAVENWRDRLLDEGERALADFMRTFPSADAAMLAELTDRARRQPADKRPRRALFRQINEVLNTAKDRSNQVE